jgi:DNA-binding CsgD family transcriptional regulator
MDRGPRWFVSFIMRAEVSCRVAAMLIGHARRSSWDFDRLLEGTGTTLAHLDDPYGWIDYDAMARLCVNTVEIAGSAEALREIAAGAGWGVLGPFRRMLELLGDPGIAYALAPAWMVLTNRVATASVNLVERGVCVLWGSYQVSHPAQPLADQLVAGALSSVPRIFGMPDARVEILESRARGPRQVAFRITYAKKSGAGTSAALLARLVTRPQVLAAFRATLSEIDAELGRLAGGRAAHPPSPPPLTRGDKLERLELLRAHFDATQLEASGLTRREIEVAQHACVGMVNKEIAEALKISVPTVKEHFSNIFSKMGVENRTELASVMLRAPAHSTNLAKGV